MELPKDYPLAVAIALGMNLQCFLNSMAVSACRKKIFPQQFMDKEFGLKHKSQLGQQIKSGGYPDTGNGVYSQKLSYKDWHTFNILQRIHMNYVENIHLATGATLAAGLYNPKRAAYIGLIYIFGRILYSSFYKKKGGAWNKLRVAGTLICLISIVANTVVFGRNFYNAYSK